MAEKALLVSLRPRFAALVLSGEKTVELRRISPNVEPGTLVLLYESSPTRTLVGHGRIEKIETGDPDSIWTSHHPATGLTRAEFDDYFTGTDRAVAITLRDARPLASPASLEELRRRWTGFRPPQSFRYLDPSQVARLIAPASR
jgi:predicted transcriptional regulator